jgi:hypothetical protein
MELATKKTHIGSVIETFVNQAQENNLTYNASDAAEEMGFEDTSEFHDAVERTMKLCLQAGVPLEGNFKRIYTCSRDGIVYDFKLSVLAYRMLCLNGGSSNSKVAKMQIELLKSQHINSK